jgi:chromosome partitioning protein
VTKSTSADARGGDEPAVAPGAVLAEDNVAASDRVITALEEAAESVTRLGPTGRPMPELPDPAPPVEHGPAHVIAMCNQKGGVGKTTTAINLGAALAERGRRVLLVDFDPQGALSVGLGVNPHELERTVYNLLMERDVTVDDILLKTNVPDLDLVPSNIDLSAAEVQLVGEVAREQTLGRVLAPVLPDYDYVIIDCQPSLGLLTVNALTAADGVMVPLECEFFALRGVALLMDTILKVQQRLNPQLELEGILATMYDARTLHGREVLARVVEAFGDRVFHTVIARTVRFPETTVVGEPITTYAPGSGGATAYRQLALEVLARHVPEPGANDAAAAADPTGEALAEPPVDAIRGNGDVPGDAAAVRAGDSSVDPGGAGTEPS